MSAIVHWLDQHDLGQHAQLFAQHAIDLDVVQHLSEGQIEQLGLPLGDRIRLQRAIAALAGDASGFGPSNFEAGRRQLTVLFCDLVGSTALAQSMDPEDFGDIIRAYTATAAAAVARYQGHIARYMGDGLMVYFGYPLANEDDAERAIRCGLDIIASVRALDLAPQARLQTRVGIATGLVVVGDVVGEGSSQEHTALGRTPNLAARLQAAAEPDSVLVSSTTKRLVEGRLELDPVGDLKLKGIAEPTLAYKATEVRESGRLRTVTRQRLARFVGRVQELETLNQRWELARQGQGQIVLIGGEPGIGKSLLVEGLRQRMAGAPHLCLRYQCAAFHMNSPFHPVIAQISQSAALAPGEGAASALPKLEALLQAGFSPSRGGVALALLALLLSIQQTQVALPPMTPKQQRTATIELIKELIAWQAQRQPLLLVLEDAHWIDPSTRELMDALAPTLATLPVLLVITYRPPFESAWQGASGVTELALGRMDGQDSAIIVRQLAGAQELAPRLLRQILERSDGIPFFIEEMTLSVLEAQAAEAAPGATPSGAHAGPVAVPSTLRDSLMARLDRLGPARAVAQVGAVIGREFSHELLAAATQLDERALSNALDRLIATQLVFRRGQDLAAVYVFNHALARDAAYESLLRKRRQDLHGRIGNLLEEGFESVAHTKPELLAHHFDNAGMSDKALRYWRAAGARAYRSSALEESVSHFSHALECLPQLPDSAQRLELEVSLLTEKGEALMQSKGFAAPQVRAVYERAQALVAGISDSQNVAKVVFGLWAYNHVRADIPKARLLAERLCRISKSAGNPETELPALAVLGITTHCAGELALSRQSHEQVVRHYRFNAEQARAQPYINDPGAISRAYLASTLWHLGLPEQALAMSEQALANAKAIAHPHSLATVLAMTARFHTLGRDLERTLAVANETIAVSKEYGFPLWRVQGGLLVSWVQAERGQDPGVEHMQAAIAAYRANGVGVSLPYYAALHAEQLAKRGRLQEARDILSQALEEAARTGALAEEPEIRRILGESLRLGGAGANAQAERCLLDALAQAQAQGALALRLRIAISLARLLRDTARMAQARTLLARERGLFSEGRGTHDLQAADLLLAELA